MAKLPWMKWFPDDYMSSTMRANPTTCGVWMNILMYMHLNGRTGTVSGSVESLARIGRCTVLEMEVAISELESFEIADVTKSNGRSQKSNADVTLVNRRMRRAYIKQNSNKLRKQKHDQKKRCNATSNADVTDKKTEDRRQKTEREKKSKEKKGDFIPPALPDLILFMISISGTEDDGSAMFNYYQSNGWKVGKNKMADWKSCAKNWLSRKKEFEKSKTNGKSKTGNDIDAVRDWYGKVTGSNPSGN